MIIKKQIIQIHKNLRSIKIKDSNDVNRLFWLFESSAYEILVIDIAMPYPCIKISSQSPIQYFTTIYIPQQKLHYLIIVDNQGKWVAYQVTYKNKQVAVEQIFKASLAGIENKVVGIHMFADDSTMILFVKENGNIQYNYLSNQNNGGRFSKINKIYELDPPNDNYRRGKLYNKYQGRELLRQLSRDKILGTAYKASTKELIIAAKDINSGVCSIHRFFIQHYEVMASIDLLFNLPFLPLEIITLNKMVIINLGFKILVWVKNLTQEINPIQQGSFCTSLQIQDEAKQSLICCFVKNSTTAVYMLFIDLQFKDGAKPVVYRFEKLYIVESPQIILHCSGVQNKQKCSIMGITSKLEVVEMEKDNQNQKKILVINMQATIVYGSVQQKRYANYIKAVKRVGYLQEHKIVTNNCIVAEMQQYQHNMLLKMAYCLKHLITESKAELYLSSPIIATLKLAVQFTKTGHNQSGVVISSGSSQPSLVIEQQSLFIGQTNNQQITPTKLLTKKSKYNVGDFFQGTSDFVLKGCILGGYGLLLVERQVHVFAIEPKPKRLHIYCFDSEVKQIISLNDVNMWAALLWDGSLQILRIHQKQSVKINQIILEADCSIGYKLSYNISINTAPHTFTIFSNHLIICSNDPLHIYQVEKTTLKIIPLDEKQFGKDFYPLIDLTTVKPGNQKFMLLSNVGSRWVFLSFANKYLVKDFDEIKIEIQQILAFPPPQNLIVAILKDNSLILLCSTKLLALTLHWGPITYKCTTSLLNQKQNKQTASLCHLRKWLKNEQILHSKLILQNCPNIQLAYPNIIKMSESKVLLCGQKQIWYSSVKNKIIKHISYFAMPNDAFIEFRNNLGLHQLQNVQFMQMFTEKLPIIAAARIAELLFAVLYEKMVIIVQVHGNGGLAIKQSLAFSQCPGLICVSQFIGVYDDMSLYMKDIHHRLILLKYDRETQKHNYQILQQLQDDIVSINRVRGWKQRSKKISLMRNQRSEYEELRIKKDGQLVIGNDVRQTYI